MFTLVAVIILDLLGGFLILSGCIALYSGEANYFFATLGGFASIYLFAVGFIIIVFAELIGLLLSVENTLRDIRDDISEQKESAKEQTALLKEIAISLKKE